MSIMGQVHWHEGLFLQPHHLQVMQHQVLERIAAERRLATVYPYGVVEAKLSPDALENMLVRFDRLRVIMPSGLEVNIPENAELPSFDISAPFAASSGGFRVNLAVPLWYPNRANAIEPGSGGDWRVKRLYQVSETQRPDENTGEGVQPMMLRRINARLILDEDDHTDLEVVPLMRIVHGTGEAIGLGLNIGAWAAAQFLSVQQGLGGLQGHGIKKGRLAKSNVSSFVQRHSGTLDESRQAPIPDGH